MEITQLILEVLILIGIFYVAFIQDRVTKIKDKLLETLKDYPEAAEAFLKMERRKIEEEIENKFMDEMKIKLEKILDVQKKDGEKLSRIGREFAIFIGKIIVTVGPNPMLEKFIEEIEYDVVKTTIKRYYNEIKNKIES